MIQLTTRNMSGFVLDFPDCIRRFNVVCKLLSNLFLLCHCTFVKGSFEVNVALPLYLLYLQDIGLGLRLGFECYRSDSDDVPNIFPSRGHMGQTMTTNIVSDFGPTWSQPDILSQTLV